MNFLKKTLGKDEGKKQERSRIPNTSTPLKKNKQIWSNVDELIEGRSDKKNKVEEYDQTLIRVFREFDESRKLLGDAQFGETLDQLVEEYNSCYKYKASATTGSAGNRCETLEDIDAKLQHLLRSEADLGNKNLVLLFSEKLKKLVRQTRKADKDQKLKEFDNMVSFLTMKKKPAKVLESSDNNDFIIKVTKEEYTLESGKRMRSKKKSLGTLNSGSLSGSSNNRNSLSRKVSEGDVNHKLQSLLKDGSLKVVKTSIKYDYSAILESSFANIQRRNNMTNNPALRKEESKPIEKVKKNEGFVFFRPNQKK